MTTKCTGLMGLIFGHRFRPVITLGNPTITDLNVKAKGRPETFERIINATKSEEFHGCFCQRCGAVTGEKK